MNDEQTIVNEEEAGESGAQTGESGAQTGENGAETGESGAQTGENDDQAGENDDQAGENDYQTGESGDQTDDTSFATVQDMITLWRPMSLAEQARAANLLPIVSDSLRMEARKVGKDLDAMIAGDSVLASVAKSVTVDVTARAIMTPTDETPTTQFSQSALGYSVSGSYLVPGGGLFIKKSELARLGLRRQQIGVLEPYGTCCRAPGSVPEGCFEDMP